VVEADAQLGPHLVADGDVVIAMESSGIHSNGFSLVRHILANKKIGYTDRLDDFGGIVGEVLLEPTRLYTTPLLNLLAAHPGAVHALSHVTGGGIAANLARVLPIGSWVEVERSTWSPPSVFRVLSDLAGSTLESAEGTWNLGIGMIAIVAADAAGATIAALTADGIPSWEVGRVSLTARDFTGFEQGAKGVNGGAVRLTGLYGG
jgi:phosphoribosylformylglycinamidine cyclo-ligase